MKCLDRKLFGKMLNVNLKMIKIYIYINIYILILRKICLLLRMLPTISTFGFSNKCSVQFWHIWHSRRKCLRHFRKDKGTFSFHFCIPYTLHSFSHYRKNVVMWNIAFSYSHWISFTNTFLFSRKWMHIPPFVYDIYNVFFSSFVFTLHVK